MTVVIWTSSSKQAFLNRVCKPVFGVTKTEHRTALLSDGIPKLEDGDVLVSMGGLCMDALKDAGKVPKNRGIKSFRENELTVDGHPCFVTYDPGIIEVDSAREPEIVYDIRLACRRHDTGTLMPTVGKYKYVKNFNKVIKQIKKQWRETRLPVYVSGDLETIGFDPWMQAPPWDDPEYDGPPDARIVTLSFTVKPGTAYVYRIPESGIDPDVRDQVELILTSPKVKITGANWKFDAVWILHHWGILCTNQKFDTGLVGGLLDENRSNSLNLHAKVYTDMGGYDDDFNHRYDKSRMDLVIEDDPEGFLTYAGGDTDACLRVTHVLKKKLVEDKQLANFYMNLLQPASQVFTKLEHRGVYVDESAYDKLENDCMAEMRDFHERAVAMIPRKLRIKHNMTHEFDPDNLILTKPTIIKEFLFTKRGLNLNPKVFTAKAKAETWEYASTTGEHLEMFRNEEDAAAFIEAYEGFNGAKKTLSTYIIGFRKHLRSDGMFHPSYNMYKGDFGSGDDSGTVTGRLSARDPAYQTIPKHTKWAKPLRTVYVAPPGYAILKLDYSQGELRVTACVADERNMIDAYKAGLDMHLKTGAQVFGITLEKALKWKKKGDERIKAVRQGGKAGNFGLIYGMSPVPGFVNYAWNTYGVKLTNEDAIDFHKAFFELYPGLVNWHNTYKNHARNHKYVRNPLGRVRHLPLINSRNPKVRSGAERQSINSPIQSCLSDMMLLAMVEIDRAYPDLHMFGMTHDEMQCYVPIDEVDIWAKRIGEIMSNLPLDEFGWYPELEFPADAEWSTTNLAECVELE